MKNKTTLFVSVLVGGLLCIGNIAEAHKTTRPIIQVSSGENLQQTVLFNTKTHKFHNPSCEWAKRCTKNCIPMNRGEAIKRGGIACKVCGG